MNYTAKIYCYYAVILHNKKIIALFLKKCDLTIKHYIYFNSYLTIV